MKNIKIVVLLSFFLGYPFFSYEKAGIILDDYELMQHRCLVRGVPGSMSNTDPKIIGKIYQLVKVADAVLTKHNITYWAQGGSLLGAIRHKGIIPWDDDADMFIFVSDVRKLMRLNSEFKKYNCILTVKAENHRGVPALFKLYQGADKLHRYLNKNGKLKRVPSELTKYLHPFLDIFTARYYSSDLIHYVWGPGKSGWPNGYFLKSELFPLVRVPFGPLSIVTPNNPMPYLLRHFGADTMTVAHQYNHIYGHTGQSHVITSFEPAAYQ